MDNLSIPAYIGRAECGCVIAAVVDDGTDPDMVSEHVAEFVKGGLVVERQTVGYVREHWGCQHKETERYNNGVKPTSKDAEQIQMF